MTIDAGSFLRAEMDKVSAALAEARSEEITEVLETIVSAIVSSLRSGGKVMFCGNGGSAADAQHLAAELVGRQNFDRQPAAGIALTVDSSALTAIANDYGYDLVFARQVMALGRPGDVLIGISTSGRSASVVQALKAAREIGVQTVAVTGRDPRALGDADFVLAVPAEETAVVQQVQMACAHAIFALVEQLMFGERCP